LPGLKNGDLLTAAESAEFDAFLTLDQGIEYQQNLIDRKIAIVVFRAKSSRLKDLLPLIPACLTARFVDGAGTSIVVGTTKLLAPSTKLQGLLCPENSPVPEIARK
jgi:hypothetical protein